MAAYSQMERIAYLLLLIRYALTLKKSVRAVVAGEQPAGLDGPPSVDELVPGRDANEIMITVPVTATFSEAVDPRQPRGR